MDVCISVETETQCVCKQCVFKSWRRQQGEIAETMVDKYWGFTPKVDARPLVSDLAWPEPRLVLNSYLFLKHIASSVPRQGAAREGRKDDSDLSVSRRLTRY